MTDCLFCKIAAGEIPATKIYEDEHTFAFLDINPVNPGHILVVPKDHSENILDIESEPFAHVMETVRKLSPAIKEGVSADSINIHMIGEDVQHTHVQIIPRFLDDGYKFWIGQPYEDEQGQIVAKQIINQL